MRDIAIDILQFLSDSLGENFTSYSHAVAEKTVRERSAQLALNDISSYFQLVCSDPIEASCFARMLRVRYSVFFRDALQFELLGSVILPSMLGSCPNGAFRVWSAACAGGEETYSLAILLDELLQLLETRPQVQLFGTDIAEDALKEADTGIYSPDRLDAVTMKRIKNYFIAQHDRYRVTEEIRQMTTFSRHDLLSRRTYAPPESIFGGFDVILCRNFLMYLDARAYSQVCDNLFRALNPGGILMLGSVETLPERYAASFETIFEFGHMYRKKSVNRSH